MCFGKLHIRRVNTLKWLMYIAQEKGWIRVHPFASFECMPEQHGNDDMTGQEKIRLVSGSDIAPDQPQQARHVPSMKIIMPAKETRKIS